MARLTERKTQQGRAGRPPTDMVQSTKRAMAVTALMRGIPVCGMRPGCGANLIGDSTQGRVVQAQSLRNRGQQKSPQQDRNGQPV